MEFIKELSETTFIGNHYNVVYIACIFLCLILMQKRRIKIILPMILISVVILNPWFYKLWTDLAGYAYWRIIWIIPVLPVCAAVPAIIVEKINDDRIKLKAGIILVTIFAGVGKYVYNTPAGKFEIVADNPEKLPQYVIDVSDNLLEIEEHPRVVASTDISVYIRQYTGEIDTLFGRDIYGHILRAGDIARNVSNELKSEDGDMEYVAEIMLNEEYDYLVLRNETDERKRELTDAGFEVIYGTDDYNIYKVNGIPSVVKDRNELGQVVCETIVDESGNPADGSSGYAHTYYEYDRDGNISKLFRTNLNGEGVINNSLSAGYERTYGRYGQVLSEKNLGADGKPALNKKGYAEVRREYNKRLWLSESYYDVSGEPIERIDVGYAAIKVKRDDEGRVIEKAYYDENDKSTVCIKGYAKVDREYDQDGRLIKEKYYNSDGSYFMADEGYSGVFLSYDTDGNLISKKFIDGNDDMVSTNDGYAEARWEKDEEKDVFNISFYDYAGTEVSIEEVNLYTEMCAGWSEWMLPYRNTQNSCFDIGSVNLGEKNEGDEYICEIEIEFKDVTATEGKDFRFRTQGAVDGKWDIGNVWNRSLIYLEEVPSDGIYSYTATQTINETMQYASVFQIGFRCDNWASGSFRVRNITIKKCLK